MLEERTLLPVGNPSPAKPEGPLFLVGAPRSGTTLVYKMLCLHPETAWISNWNRVAPGMRSLSALNRFAPLMPNARHRAWFGENSNAYVYGAGRGLRQRLVPAPVEGEPLFRRAGLGEAEITSPADVPLESVEALRKAFRAIQRYSGGMYFVNKRVANNRRIPLLAEAFPTARFLEIVRDGRSVAQSLSTVDWWPNSRIWWNGVTPLEWEAEGRDPWELCARSWVEELKVTSRGLSFVAPSKVMKVAYEDFVSQPRQLLEEIRLFAGLPDSERWQRSVDRCECRPCEENWRQQLSPSAISNIESIQVDLLRLHGYRTLSPLTGSYRSRPLEVEAPQAH
ncbi:MAG TPA: sulfotransferase [Actinomycetota bacterium]|nr:sulfotransferase [Actinomycetota bacterium]